MPNIFLDIPVPAADGPGAAVDTSAMGGEKSFTIDGDYSGSITVEVSNEGANGPWAPLTTFKEEENKRTIRVAARFIRARRAGTTIIPGTVNLSVGSSDNGGMFADLPFDGTPVDVSTFGGFKTVIVDNLLPQSILHVEISEDGTDWNECFSFQTTGLKSKEFYAQFMRARLAGPGAPNVDVGAINDATAMAAIDFGPPITVRGPTNAEGVSTDVSRADHDHRLEYEVEDEGVLVSARPRINFVGDGVGAVDIPGQDKTEVTIPGPNLGDGGAVVKRSVYVSTSTSTSSPVFVDAMSGNFVTVPIDGDYLAIIEAEGENQNAASTLELGISVNSLVAAVAGSERKSMGNASDVKWVGTSVQLPGLTAGDLIRALFHKTSGPGSVSLHRRHLVIMKVQ